MRLRDLIFLLGLVSAGACTSSRTHRAEPLNPKSADRQSEASKTQPAANPDRTTATASAPESKETEPETRDIEVVEEKYDNGVVRKRVEGYRDAAGELVPHGLTTTWYESGLKWTETTFRDGIKHGPQRKWYNTGAEWSNNQYDDGIEDGLWTAYHPNGEKAREIRLDHGVWDGLYVEYHPNGRKSMEVMFVKGLRQGVSRVYDEDGSVVMVTDYIDGVEQP